MPVYVSKMCMVYVFSVHTHRPKIEFMYSQKWSCAASFPTFPTFMYLWAIHYSQNWSAYLAAAKYADRSWEYINRSQIHECGNWETEHYNSVLEITQFHFWEYIDWNQTFILDSHQPFICSAGIKVQLFWLGLGLSPLPGLLRPSHLPPAGYQVHFLIFITREGVFKSRQLRFSFLSKFTWHFHKKF